MSLEICAMGQLDWDRDNCRLLGGRIYIGEPPPVSRLYLHNLMFNSPKPGGKRSLTR